MNYKSCSKCGKIHPRDFKCSVGRVYSGGEERKLRSTYQWTLKSQEIREKAHHLCEVCRDRGLIEYKDIEVHHIEKVRNNMGALLDDNNLISLCPTCHRMADAGKISQDYLKELARNREQGAMGGNTPVP